MSLNDKGIDGKEGKNGAMITIPGTIPVTIHPLFFVMATAIGWMNRSPLVAPFWGMAVWICVIFISVLAHEYGHALTARAFGQQAKIQLVMFGGLTFREGKKLKFWQDFLVVMNGPLVGIFMCVSAMSLRIMMVGASPFFLVFIDTMIYGNMVWSFLNLIPIVPLDGGYLMSILFEAVFGFKGVIMALRVSLFVSVIVGAILFVYAGIAGAFFFVFAFENVRSLRRYGIMTEKDNDAMLRAKLAEARRKKEEGATRDALMLFQEVRDLSKAGMVYTIATQNSAEILCGEGKTKEGYDLLSSIQKNLPIEDLILLQRLAYHYGDNKKALKVGAEVFLAHADPDVALYNALASARDKNIDAVIGWLGCFEKEGGILGEVVKNSGFDSVRDDMRFRTFVNS